MVGAAVPSGGNNASLATNSTSSSAAGTGTSAARTSQTSGTTASASNATGSAADKKPGSAIGALDSSFVSTYLIAIIGVVSVVFGGLL